MKDSGRPVLLIVLVLIALPLLWGTAMMGIMWPGMMGEWDGWNPWRGVLAMLLTVLILGGLVTIGWWAFGRGGRSAELQRTSRGARDVLDDRYARGELTRRAVPANAAGSGVLSGSPRGDVRGGGVLPNQVAPVAAGLANGTRREP